MSHPSQASASSPTPGAAPAVRTVHQSLRHVLARHVVRAAEAVVGPEAVAQLTLRDAGLNPPKLAQFGDLSTPIALTLAKVAKRPPRAIAEALLTALGTADGLLAQATLAGPGHINLTVAPEAWRARLWLAIADGAATLASEVGANERVLLEFVSANPTGPLHLAHGRGAVYGDVLGRILHAAGYDVTREYYVNDLGNQTDVLAQSVFAHLQALAGRPFVEPPQFYPGAYVRALAEQLAATHGLATAKPDAPADEQADAAQSPVAHDDLTPLKHAATSLMLERIKADLAQLGVAFDSFVSERAVLDDAAVPQLLARLRAAGHLYEQDGKLWFRTTTFGDDKDRVLVREDGRPTYVLGDIAYHEQKVQRGFRRLINVWGADHAGYLARVKAGLAALGHDPACLEVDYVQMVGVTRAGTAVKMGKRLGTAVWLKDIIDETGRDPIRYWFLLRRLDAQMELDLELAAERSLKNPVYYAQMGHARLQAIARKAAAAGVGLAATDAYTLANLAPLTLPEEVDLMRALARAPDVVADAARAHEPHAVVTYVQELIGLFHSYYGRYKATERVISDDRNKTVARLLLCRGLANVLAGLLDLLGVAAPMQMALNEDELWPAPDAPKAS